MDLHHLTITELERLALSNRINLSDGHARHPLTPGQRAILANTLGLHDEALSRKQPDIEAEFLKQFAKHARQTWVGSDCSFLSYSASSTTCIMAQYCRSKNLRVMLIEPCFDNIRHLLIEQGVDVIPVSEQDILDTDGVKAKLDSSTVLWLVQPNNPTGFCLDENQFTTVVGAAASCDATIVVDFCFRFFARGLRTWDQYAILAQSGVKYVCLEDTGKTWPLADMKVGIAFCSAVCAYDLHRLHDQLLLNVSPVHLLLLRDLMIHDESSKAFCLVSAEVEKNRTLFHELVEKGIVTHESVCCGNTPMELLGLPSGLQADVFWERLRARGVDILPARNYFWANPSRGETMFRVPLSRPSAEVAVAIPIIEDTIANLMR